MKCRYLVKLAQVPQSAQAHGGANYCSHKIRSYHTSVYWFHDLNTQEMHRTTPTSEKRKSSSLFSIARNGPFSPRYVAMHFSK